MTNPDLEAAAARAAEKLAAEASTWAPRLRLALAFAAALLLGIAGAWAYHWLTPHAVPEVMTQAPQVAQTDGSQIAARAPDAHPPAPPHQIPRGYREVRRDSVTVAPAPDAAASGCPPVTVNLSTVRNGADQRVVASSPDGQVVAAIDIPIEAAMIPPPPRPWGAGVSYGTDRAVGVWLERDVGRLRLGAEVAKGDRGARAELRIGVAF